MAWTINNGKLYFNSVLYTGNGSAGNSITGVNFQPDFTWIKDRDNVRNHVLTDAVRGVTKNIFSNTSGAESTDTSTLTAFNSDGFTLGNGTKVNGNSINFVSWNWKAGTAVSGNTSGSGTYKTYTGSVNTTSGFSIIKYVGNGTAGHTIPHNLGTANIGSIFVKNLDSGSDYWYSYHKPLGATKTLILNEADAVGTNTMWNNTAPTSSVFSVGTQSAVNTNNSNYIAYIFADIQGYCKTGLYTGNGNADGPFIFTGFKPAFAIIKNSSANNGWWQIEDNERNPFNVADKAIFANVSDAEYNNANYNIDYVSNGFKLRNSTAGSNVNGNEYMYIAFAEAPLVGTNNIPANAR